MAQLLSDAVTLDTLSARTLPPLKLRLWGIMADRWSLLSCCIAATSCLVRYFVTASYFMQHDIPPQPFSNSICSLHSSSLTFNHPLMIKVQQEVHHACLAADASLWCWSALSTCNDWMQAGLVHYLNEIDITFEYAIFERKQHWQRLLAAHRKILFMSLLVCTNWFQTKYMIQSSV